MAEGGVYPWKIQKVERFGPSCTYSNLTKPLPPPPKGMIWDKDVDTKEWKLINEKQDEKEEEREESTDPSYIKHKVLPTDTLTGICLKYKISAVKVRQINRFSGSNLHLAPNPLIIPIVDPQLLVDGTIKVQEAESREMKLPIYTS
mmetsp:Transcript_38752/g.56905  ORF Transcript_38752/g.56905 Transcript_38752/m.56905 type:complete len:146 (-) Transcript_38752:284-721(-)